MAAAIKFGLAAPSMLPKIGGSALIGTGLVMVLTALAWIFLDRRKGQGDGLDS